MDKLLEQSIDLYKSGLPLLKVQSITGINCERLRRALKKTNSVRSNKINSRKYSVNHSFFDNIDTEEKAYWLGFLYADGYITRHQNTKRIGLSLKDTEILHLEKYKKAIEATYNIKHYINKSWGFDVPYVRLIITSDHMFDILQSKGVLERKSLILTFPNNDIVSKELVHHFIRGYFDGDGSFAKTNVQRSPFSVKICGTKEFLNSLCEHIGHPNPTLYRRHKEKTNNNYSIYVGGRKQVVAIGNYLYDNATVFLERKYKRYKSINY